MEWSEDLFHFLRNCQLFMGLSEEELNLLLPFLEEKKFKVGDWLIRERDTSQDLLILKKGKAEVIKQTFDDYQVLGTIETGDWVGEMALIDKKSRSASIRALEPSTVLVLTLEESHPSYLKLFPPLAEKIVERLRRTNESVIVALKEQWKLILSHNQTNNALIQLIILLAIYFGLANLSSVYLLQYPLFPDFLVPVIIVVPALGVLWVIAHSRLPLSYYGLTWKNGWKDAWEATLFSIPIFLVLYGATWAFTRFHPVLKGMPIFVQYDTIDFKTMALLTGIYFLLIPFQELIVRGFLQTTLRDFFLGPNRVILAIFTSNFVFELLHTMKGFWWGILAFIGGLFWGFLYEKQKSLVGVTVSHILIGAWSFCILNIQTLLFLLE